MGSQEAVDPVRHQFLRHTRITVVRTVEIKALRLRFCQACIRSYTLDRMICLCSRYGAKASLDAQSMMVGSPSVDAPLQARENVGIVAARGRMLSSVRPSMRQEHSRRPVWEFADRVQITRSVLEAQWKALVVPAPSRRLLRHTLLPLALTSSRSWSAYAAAAGVR